MANYTKTVPWLDGVAFASLALGILAAVFFWMPAVGVVLAAIGLLSGFFGWVLALEYGDSSAFYLLMGTVISTVTLILNLAVVTGWVTAWWL